MPEQMSGLQPTKQDLEWYEKQKQEKPLFSQIIDKGMQLNGLAGDLVQASPVLRTLTSGASFVGEKIEEGREHLEGIATEESKYGTDAPLYPGATQSAAGIAGNLSNQLRQGSEYLRQGATAFAKDRAIPAIEQATGRAVDPRTAGIYGEAVGAIPGALTEEALTAGAGTALKGLRSIDRLTPPPQLQVSLAGVSNGQAVSRNMLENSGVMKFTDEQIGTLGTGPANRSVLDSVDPKYRYFDEESLKDMQGPMMDREPAIRKAKEIEAQWEQKLQDAQIAGDQKAIKYARKKLKDARRKANDLVSGPPEELVPNNPQTYHSGPAAKAARAEGGVDADGAIRNELHHESLENTEGGRLFRRKNVLKDVPQAAILYWEHLRRLGIVPGGGKLNMLALSATEHTGKTGMHAAIRKWRGFFEDLPDDISLNDLMKKTEEFAASLDDSDKYLESIGLPARNRDIAEGVLMQNQAGRLIKEVQSK